MLKGKLLNLIMMTGVALLLPACGEIKTNIIDGRTVEYVNRFETIFGIKYTGNVIIVNHTLINNEQLADAFCTYDYVSKRYEVVIDGLRWAKSDDGYKEQLMFHELAHCTKNIKHNENLMDNGCANSIMYPYTFGSSNERSCYEFYREHYIEELKRELMR